MSPPAHPPACPPARPTNLTRKVIDMLDAQMGAHLFGDSAADAGTGAGAFPLLPGPEDRAGNGGGGDGGGCDGGDGGDGGGGGVALGARACPACGSGRLGLKLSRAGGSDLCPGPG